MVNQGTCPYDPRIICRISTFFQELFVGFRRFFKNYLSDFDIFFKNYLSDFDIFYIFAADNQ